MPRGVPGEHIPRKVTKAWLAEQLGVHRHTVEAWARDKARLDLSDFASVCRFVVAFLDRRGHVDPAATPVTLLGLAGKNLHLCGVAAQRLSVGTFMWAPVAGGAYAYAGELAGELEARLGARLNLPPFASRLAALDELVARGLGTLPEAQRLLAEVATVVGPDDPVLSRLRLRAAVRGVGR
ncbi:MAG: hypothetical protein E6Q97_20135 [Desulfurellales bacterium]|nr:MAG: hypothetical protein E6Q97_20135 [Desulfurellales bacterium]